MIVEGSADASILIRKVSAGAMPPPGMGARVDKKDLDRLRHWVDTSTFALRADKAGAERETFTEKEAPPITDEDRRYWAFRKPRKHPEPAVRGRKRLRTPIDAFVLARLESEGLGFSPDAPKEVLLRRAFFDLIGLPPKPRGDRRLHVGYGARSVRADDRPPVGLAALRRTLGEVLAGRGGLH